MDTTPEEPGSFASSVKETPAVKATGTNGASGVEATSDSAVAVFGNSNSGAGVVGVTQSEATDGIGVQGISTFGLGVHGHCAGGTGVWGETTGGTGVKGSTLTGSGIHGSSRQGTGVMGESETGSGVQGTSGSGPGILGIADSNNTGSFGVEGRSPSGHGVHGFSTHFIGVSGESDTSVGVSGKGGSIGVMGVTHSGDGVLAESAVGTGLLARSTEGLAGRFVGNVQVDGNLSVTGTKAFVHAHPTDPEREIVYVALEGGEAGTYARGSGQLERGEAVLALPEHFGLVTDPSGLTVQLTPHGQWLQLYVLELTTAQLVVREVAGRSGTFDYLVHGVRRGSEPHQVIRTTSVERAPVAAARRA
jgi:hypothetical protein